jgi:transcriptional regulator with GAF, ATPase, and Fis domain
MVKTTLKEIVERSRGARDKVKEGNELSGRVSVDVKADYIEEVTIDSDEYNGPVNETINPLSNLHKYLFESDCDVFVLLSASTKEDKDIRKKDQIAKIRGGFIFEPDEEVIIPDEEELDEEDDKDSNKDEEEPEEDDKDSNKDEEEPDEDDDGITKKQLEKALEENGDNKTKTAASLGISRSKLYKKLKEFGIM